MASSTSLLSRHSLIRQMKSQVRRVQRERIAVSCVGGAVLRIFGLIGL